MPTNRWNEKFVTDNMIALAKAKGTDKSITKKTPFLWKKKKTYFPNKPNSSNLTRIQSQEYRGHTEAQLQNQILGYDIDGTRISPFDFIATIFNNFEADPTMEQADANSKNVSFNGYVINNPLAKAWKNLEYSLLNTIKRYKQPITLKDPLREQTIKIFPNGGKSLDIETTNPIENYPTFQITYHSGGSNRFEDIVDYEYFQISAEQRAWIALNLIEKLA